MRTEWQWGRLGWRTPFGRGCSVGCIPSCSVYGEALPVVAVTFGSSRSRCLLLLSGFWCGGKLSGADGKDGSIQSIGNHQERGFYKNKTPLPPQTDLVRKQANQLEKKKSHFVRRGVFSDALGGKIKSNLSFFLQATVNWLWRGHFQDAYSERGRPCLIIGS